MRLSYSRAVYCLSMCLTWAYLCVTHPSPHPVIAFRLPPSGNSSNGGASGRAACLLGPREDLPIGRRGLELHSSSAYRVVQRLPGEKQRGPHHFPLLLRTPGESGEAAARCKLIHKFIHSPAISHCCFKFLIILLNKACKSNLNIRTSFASSCVPHALLKNKQTGTQKSAQTILGVDCSVDFRDLYNFNY